MKKLFRNILRFFKNLISKFNVLIQLINALMFTLGYILILLALVVDIIAPGTVGIDAGLTGLIALVALLYVGVLRPFMVLSAVYSAGGINRELISRVERQNRLDAWFYGLSFIVVLFLSVLVSFMQ